MANEKETPSIYDKDSDFHQVTEHNSLDYPVKVSFIDVNQLYLGRIRWHWHEEIEVMIVNHGCLEVLTEDNSFTIKAGQGVLISQNIFHSLKPVGDVSSSIYSVLFHPAFLFGYAQTYFAGKYVAPVVSSPALAVALLDDSDAWGNDVLNLINDVIAVNLTQKFGYELQTKAFLCNLWNTLLKKVAITDQQSQIATSASMDEERVKQGIRYIEKHYMDAISLDEIADFIHISKSECCRCFKRCLQISPFEYLMKYRIYSSIRKIRYDSPDASSISTLAFSVGFNNTSYYNKIFKKYMHCTPSEYKKELRNRDSNQVDSPFTPTML